MNCFYISTVLYSPNWENDTLKRKAVLKGDKMEIKTEDVTYGGEQIIGVIGWQKVN